MAFLRRRGKVWYLYWSVGPKGARRKYARRISTNREISREALRKRQDEEDRSAAGLQGGYSYLAEHAEAWERRLAGRVAAGDLASTTAVRARQALRAFLVWLQENHPKAKRVGQVTREIVGEYQLARASLQVPGWKRRRGGIKAKSINTELSLIRPMFREAVRAGQLFLNPFDGLRKLKERDSIPARQLAPDQIGRLLKIARKVDPQLFPYLAGYVYTGARRSELFAVTWADVNLEDGIILVPNLKTSSHADDRSRPVPIHPALKVILQRRRKLERPWPTILRSHLRNRFLRVTRAAGMPWLTRLHDLRHAFAGNLISRGVQLYTVGELLGHRDPRTTKRYAVLAPAALKEAVGKLPY
jgi:integrase